MEGLELVSVVVTVYNLETYISQCIESIVSQSYENIEIIVVNDGSKDRCDDIIQQYQRKDGRVKYFKRENHGVSESRNFALSKATGKYVVFVDGDDWLEKNMIAKMMNFCNYDLVVCSYNRRYDNSSNPKVFDIKGSCSGGEFQRRLIGLQNEELYDPSNTDTFGTVWGKLFLRSLIFENDIRFVSLKEIGTAEDVLFNIEYSNYINNCYIVNEPLYNYRKINSNSLTSTHKEHLFELWQNLYSIIYNKYVERNSELKSAFYNRVCLSIFGLGLNELQSKKTYKEKINRLNNILNNSLYLKAYKKLQLKYFPIHWKIFFFFAKIRFIYGVYFMLMGIEYFVNKNK